MFSLDIFPCGEMVIVIVLCAGYDVSISVWFYAEC